VLLRQDKWTVFLHTSQTVEWTVFFASQTVEWSVGLGGMTKGWDLSVHVLKKWGYDYSDAIYLFTCCATYYIPRYTRNVITDNNK
jgi:hypothetical protein